MYIHIYICIIYIYIYIFIQVEMPSHRRQVSRVPPRGACLREGAAQGPSSGCQLGCHNGGAEVDVDIDIDVDVDIVVDVEVDVDTIIVSKYGPLILALTLFFFLYVGTKVWAPIGIRVCEDSREGPHTKGPWLGS